MAKIQTKKQPPKGNHRRSFIKGAGLTATAGAVASLSKQIPVFSADAVLNGPDKAYDIDAVSWTPPLPSVSVIALNRMGFGPQPGDIADFNALGADDDARLNAYIEQQLNPDSITDTAYNARLATANYTTLSKTRTELWTEHRRSSEYSERIKPIAELEKATFLRATYSKKQFQELICDFWTNHFNIYGIDSSLGPMVVDLVENTLRPNLFGNFREMLEGTTRNGAMLVYLDNFISTSAGANENYARELFELHTMGSENYYGTVSQNSVPTDENGLPVGYVDIDVYESSRAFTGWSLSYNIYDGDDDTGVFKYRNDDHDRHQKFVLGELIPPDQAAEKDGLDVLDRVAYHPATARYICRKLCKRLISDTPPDDVVLAAADIFYEKRFESDQLRHVYRYILQSDAFRTTWGQKVKRPFEVAVSFLRATDFNITLRLDHNATNNFIGYYNDTGQRLFAWGPPDGYPDFKEAWTSSAPRVYCWRLINYMISRATDDEDAGIVTPDEAANYYVDTIGQTPASKRAAEEIADHWINQILGRPMDAEDRQEIIDFMSQGYNEDYDLPLNTNRDTQERLRMMVALICCAPDFYWK
ncbi:MAG: DUF1800 domain-containing protein [Anaerolineae bacterium]